MKSDRVSTNPAVSTKRYLAHVRQDDNGSFVIHDLEDHLRAVGDLAGEFASNFGASDWGQLAGLWHDLGKIPRLSKTVSLAEVGLILRHMLRAPKVG